MAFKPATKKPKLIEFEIEVCRTSAGFNTLKVKAENEFEAGQMALDEAGDHYYNEKDCDYVLTNPVPNPKDVQHSMDLIMELSYSAYDKIKGLSLCIDNSDMDKIKQADKLLKDLNLSEVRYYIHPKFLYSESTPHSEKHDLECTEMVVSGGDFRITGFLPRTNSEAQTDNISINVLMASFENKESNIVFARNKDDFLEGVGLTEDESDDSSETARQR